MAAKRRATTLEWLRNYSMITMPRTAEIPSLQPTWQPCYQLGLEEYCYVTWRRCSHLRTETPWHFPESLEATLTCSMFNPKAKISTGPPQRYKMLPNMIRFWKTTVLPPRQMSSTAVPKPFETEPFTLQDAVGAQVHGFNLRSPHENHESKPGLLRN